MWVCWENLQLRKRNIFSSCRTEKFWWVFLHLQKEKGKKSLLSERQTTQSACFGTSGNTRTVSACVFWICLWHRKVTARVLHLTGISFLKWGFTSHCSRAAAVTFWLTRPSKLGELMLSELSLHPRTVLLNTSASSNVGCREQNCTLAQAESIYLGPVVHFISGAHVSYSCEPFINKQVGITCEHLLYFYCAQEENTSVNYSYRDRSTHKPDKTHYCVS